MRAGLSPFLFCVALLLLVVSACTKDTAKDSSRDPAPGNAVPAPTSVSVVEGGLSITLPTAAKPDAGK
jgi:hypothetical protein